MNEHDTDRSGWDISVIRPEVGQSDIELRGSGFDTVRLSKIRKALKQLHMLEVMAVTIYRFQISSEKNELNRQLIAAMCNEMTHVQDFQVKLYEYGFKPSVWRWAFWIVGFIFGFGSRILGKTMILKTGIWVESKAVHEYGVFLKEIPWDDATAQIVAKNGADEQGHIQRWKALLQG